MRCLLSLASFSLSFSLPPTHKNRILLVSFSLSFSSSSSSQPLPPPSSLLLRLLAAHSFFSFLFPMLKHFLSLWLVIIVVELPWRNFYITALVFGSVGFVTFRFSIVAPGFVFRTPFRDLRFRTSVSEHFVQELVVPEHQG